MAKTNASADRGAPPFRQALFDHVQGRLIDLGEALKLADYPDKLEEAVAALPKDED